MAKITPDKVISILDKLGGGATLHAPTPNTISEEFKISDEDLDYRGSQEYSDKAKDKVDRYNLALAQKQTFITPTLTNVIPFTKENLYLMCAYTGSGKSTLSANIAYPLWQEEKKVLIISNEENEEDILFRIACLHLGLNFNDYRKGRMTYEDQQQVLALFPSIIQYVRIFDVSYKDGFTSYVDGIKSVLTQIKGKGYSCVMIDYFQNIRYSRGNPKAKAFDVLYDLRSWLAQYIKSSEIPVVLFAQLHSRSKRTGEDIDNRVKDCPPIIEPATVIIEAIPNYEELYTSLIICKDRFGAQGFRLKVGFDNGKFVDYTPQFQALAKQRKQQMTANQTDQDYKNLIEYLKDDEEEDDK